MEEGEDMEFSVNEQGCQNLSEEMFNGLNEIGNIISELESMEGTLRSALGDDYESIGQSTNRMKSELGDALREFKIILKDMKEYMSRVHLIRVVMNNGN